MGKIGMEKLVEMYEASGGELDLENRLRYAMAKSMCCGKEVNTPEMREILTALVRPEHQSAKHLKAKLERLFVMADLTGSELSCAFAKSVFTQKPGIPFSEEAD
jgi:hypothetical protein